MASDLSFVNEAGNGCVIYRETTGSYVVGLQRKPTQRRKVPTLACAYATCQDLGAEVPITGTPTGGDCGDAINSQG
jgi:hypothetical protein